MYMVEPLNKGHFCFLYKVKWLKAVLFWVVNIYLVSLIGLLCSVPFSEGPLSEVILYTLYPKYMYMYTFFCLIWAYVIPIVGTS